MKENRRTRQAIIAGVFLCILAALLLAVRSGTGSSARGPAADASLVPAGTGNPGAVPYAKGSEGQTASPRGEPSGVAGGEDIQEKNARIMQELKESEFSRLLSFKEVEEDSNRLKYYIEIKSPSPEELSHLRKLAYSAEGTVGESGLAFKEESAPKDMPLADYLVNKFFLQSGNENASIIITFKRKEPDRILYSSHIKLKGTRITHIGGEEAPLKPGWRYERFLEVDYVARESN